MDSPARIAMVGVDHWYSAIPLAQEVAARADTELVAVADPDRDRAEEVVAKAGRGRATSDAEELLADPSVDLIASFTSTERNPAICLAAARAGKHLLSIKPVARTLDEAAEVVRAVRSAGVAFFPAESQLRTTAMNQQIRTWLDEGRLGQVRTASYSLWSSLPQGWAGVSDPGWFTDPERAPGGGWIDHAIYHLDQLRWLLRAEVRSVRGTAASLKYPDLGLEDYGLAVVAFDNGVIARIEDTWLASPGGGRQTMSLVGTDGAVAYDSLSGRLSLTGMGETHEGWVHLSPPSGRGSVLERLVATVRGEADPLATVDDAWHNLAACRAFYESTATWVAVTPAPLP
ncbi:Gfo/Idh/MocA family oxidoreductase [Actinopolymorpha sp. B17G11]|uniref:Gfo/Idh/MocA family protein n=1 Tax=Actinopolymorpha sp. B17G11 TaxID=3160861 RepID=UPI0032E4A421